MFVRICLEAPADVDTSDDWIDFDRAQAAEAVEPRDRGALAFTVPVDADNGTPGTHRAAGDLADRDLGAPVLSLPLPPV